MVLTNRLFLQNRVVPLMVRTKRLRGMRFFMQSLTQGELGRNIEFVLESENPEICYGGIQSKRANLKNDFRIFEG